MKGYTLLEVLVALTVFAILSTITASAMYHAFNTRARVNVQAEQLNNIQIAMTLMMHDTSQIIDRPVLGDETHQFPPFIGEPTYMEFTRGGAVTPTNDEHQSTLKRIAYICKDKKLIRRSWDTLDTPSRKNQRNKVLLTNIEACSFAYLSNSRQILPEWHPFAVQQTQKGESLPIATEFKLTLSDWGAMSGLFIIPGARYAPN